MSWLWGFGSEKGMEASIIPVEGEEGLPMIAKMELGFVEKVIARKFMSKLSSLLFDGRTNNFF